MSDAAVQSLQDFIDAQGIDKSTKHWRFELKKPPMATFDAGKKYFWRMRTNKGEMRFRLMPEVAPMHASSTIYLTLMGFYDGLAFHRVIDGFMAQGGCPRGDGRGNPGYDYDGEFSADVRHDRRGLLSMANAGPGTDGSQFFITFVQTPHLDDNHTIFGEIVEGSETLDALEAAGSRTGATTEDLHVEACTIDVE